jgi:hypothetical protein
MITLGLINELKEAIKEGKKSYYSTVLNTQIYLSKAIISFQSLEFKKIDFANDGILPKDYFVFITGHNQYFTT